MKKNTPTVTLIVTLYKDLDRLALVLDSARKQTYKPIEVIVAEDDNSQDTISFLEQYKDLNIIHISHKDLGNRKIIVLNRAICIAKGTYLVFIDGDIIMQSRFIEYQLKIAMPKRILSGRRVHLTKSLSKKVCNGSLKPSFIEKYFFIYVLRYFLFDRESRWEQGITLNPNGFLYKLISKRKRNADIIGCNWSCFKDDIVYINGFNEDYHTNTVAHDTDLTWRFKAAGYELVSSKNLANCFHIYHKASLNQAPDKTLLNYNKKHNLYICKNGLDKYCST
jgi:glycosyltransferase involved in cell wall biosynthesis